MLAANNSQTLLEPNVLYLEDKPPKIVKKIKSTNRKNSTKKDVKKKAKTKIKKLQTKVKVKKEYHLNVENVQGKNENTDPNDPLFTPNIDIKSEMGEDKIEPASEDEEEEVYFDSDNDKDYVVEKKAADHLEEVEYDCRDKRTTSKSEDEESDETEGDEDEDEPLILLKQTKGGCNTRQKKKKAPRLHNCLETCKYKCNIKFPKNQRVDIFDFYWQLSKGDKINFIRKHIRKPVLTRIRNKKRGNNCCYFLKYYKMGQTSLEEIKPLETAEASSGNNKISNVDNEGLTKICRKFFESTLAISNREIKEAIEGYELQHERVVRPLREIIKEESKLTENANEKMQKPQYLDPETGNLTDTKPKKKTKRRKPGDPEPERFPRPINCAIRCTFKCHQNFSEEERKQICDIFWSLDFKRRKDFILARIETKDVETPTTPEFRKTDRPTRAYQTRFYLRSGLNSENKRVCKHFMMNTLCINRKFIENAIKYADKTTGNYTGVDGRGKHLIHKISPERKQSILDHINSYPIWVPNKKAKIKCLHYSLSIKRMYKEYREKCTEDQIKPVSAFYYYKVFHHEFRLQFLTNKEYKKNRGFLNLNPNISHYTGEEPGGCWLDSKGNQLDIRLINPGQSLKPFQARHQPLAAVSCSSMDSTSHNINSPPTSASVGMGSGVNINQSLNFATAAAAQHLANLVDTSTAVAATTLNPRAIFQSTVQNLYESNNLPHSSTTSSIFRMI